MILYVVRGERKTLLKMLLRGGSLTSCILCVHVHWYEGGKKSVLFLIANFCTKGTYEIQSLLDGNIFIISLLRSNVSFPDNVCKEAIEDNSLEN